jgi:hypothetical protein
MRLFLMTAAAAFFPLAALMMSTEAAVAVQDTPTTINGVETVCTGVGSAKDDPRWSAYPIKVVLATTGGANLANAHVSLSAGGKELAGLDCDAPWILFRAPAGSYTVTATLIGGSGQSRSAKVTAGGGQKDVTLMFQRPPAAP